MVWKIGEIINRTGLTARSLHFYEEQGLIGPIARNRAGHRIYNQSDLLRLQQIRSLRQLGISIANMPPLLSDSSQLVPCLRDQLTQLQQQRKAMQRLEESLSRLLNQLENQTASEDRLDEMLFQTLETMTMYEKYFEQSKIDAMHNAQHDDNDSKSSMQDAWSQWVEAMESMYQSGTDPASDQVQQLMQHWNEMVAHLTENNKDQLQTFNNLFHNEPKARRDHGISDELFEYMAKATAGH